MKSYLVTYRVYNIRYQTEENRLKGACEAGEGILEAEGISNLEGQINTFKLIRAQKTAEKLGFLEKDFVVEITGIFFYKKDD